MKNIMAVICLILSAFFLYVGIINDDDQSIILAAIYNCTSLILFNTGEKK